MLRRRPATTAVALTLAGTAALGLSAAVPALASGGHGAPHGRPTTTAAHPTAKPSGRPAPKHHGRVVRRVEVTGVTTTPLTSTSGTLTVKVTSHAKALRGQTLTFLLDTKTVVRYRGHALPASVTVNPGAKVEVKAVKAADGTYTAQRVNVNGASFTVKPAPSPSPSASASASATPTSSATPSESASATPSASATS